MEKIDLTKYNSVQKKGLTYADVTYTKGYCEVIWLTKLKWQQPLN